MKNTTTISNWDLKYAERAKKNPAEIPFFHENLVASTMISIEEIKRKIIAKLSPNIIPSGYNNHSRVNGKINRNRELNTATILGSACDKYNWSIVRKQVVNSEFNIIKINNIYFDIY